MYVKQITIHIWQSLPLMTVLLVGADMSGLAACRRCHPRPHVNVHPRSFQRGEVRRPQHRSWRRERPQATIANRQSTSLLPPTESARRLDTERTRTDAHHGRVPTAEHRAASRRNIEGGEPKTKLQKINWAKKGENWLPKWSPEPKLRPAAKFITTENLPCWPSLGRRGQKLGG